LLNRSPEKLGSSEVRAYQAYLTTTRKLSASSVSPATSALRFLYKVTLKENRTPDDSPMPKKPFKPPVVFSPEEVMHFLDCIDNLKQLALFMTTYAAGPRVSDVNHLNVTDIDSQLMVLRVGKGKGSMDRYVMLSPRLLDVSRTYWNRQRPSP
jgi:site-specific recombinase XerD